MSHTMVSLEDAQTITGSKTLSAVKSLEGILFADQFSGADMGAQINAAYAAAPAAPSCTIIMVPAGVFAFTTPIVLGTSGKYAILQGQGCGQGASLSSIGGTVLNYTPTTGTSAITIDWTPTGGGGYAPGAGIRDLILVNNTSGLTNGGSGSSAIGVNIGPTNGGAHKGLFSNFRVAGFGKGVSVPDTNGVSWGMTFVNFSADHNNTGVNFAVTEENISFFSCAISVNGVGINCASGGGDITFVGGSIDSQTTMGVEFNGSGYHLTAVGVHWENLGVLGNLNFTHGTACHINIIGGLAENDNMSGNSTPWFDGSRFNVLGLSIFSVGSTLSSYVFNIRDLGYIQVQNTSPTVIPSANVAFAGAGSTIIVDDATNGIQTFGFKANGATLLAVAPTVAASQVGLGSTTATSATAGSNGVPPVQVAGYLIINVAGTAMKVPYYNT